MQNYAMIANQEASVLVAFTLTNIGSYSSKASLLVDSITNRLQPKQKDFSKGVVNHSSELCTV